MEAHKRNRARFAICVLLWGALSCALVFNLVGLVFRADAIENKEIAQIASAKMEAEELTLEDHIKAECAKYGVDYDLACAVITVESEWQADAVNEFTGCAGLMQLHPDYYNYWHNGTGLTDYLDPFQNTSAGIWHLSVLQAEYNDINLVLMCYKLGAPTALPMWESGKHEIKYVRDVKEAMK